MKTRCSWTQNKELNNTYHDSEWGVPLHDDAKLFEFLILDAFQAGLSWLTILKKRKNFRKAFDNFEASKIANYSQKKIDTLMNDTGIIRNKLKINSTISNAQAFLNIQHEFGSFDNYIWQFTNHKTIVNTFKSIDEIPTETKESQAMSKALKKRGFKFVGPTICYAFMQAAGMVNDHETSCFRYNEVMKLG
ncbi:MAG: DNA-3-methyladenine glycosylase I [Bacteroidota bacterium]|nr:DNA-3-methyladenine glycosylase I [Bacteroidota bacterium]